MSKNTPKLQLPCRRCKKTLYTLGKITEYGPVCSSCAPYFREPKPCPWCGTLSSRLSRVYRAGITIAVCPKCGNTGKGVCQLCHRFRYLMITTDGHRICNTCNELGTIFCPVCCRPMPAGRHNICEPCSWKSAVQKRIIVLKEAIENPVFQLSFVDFSTWLGNEIGDFKTSVFLYKYLPFFVDMEKVWDSIPSYQLLLSQFGADYLRRYQLPMRWLVATGKIVVVVEEKFNNSEQRRIFDSINRIPNSVKEKKFIIGYYNELQLRAKLGKITLRSIRLALYPASIFLLQYLIHKKDQSPQAILNDYLEKSPGQKMALSGFIKYLRIKCNFELSISFSKKVRKESTNNKVIEMKLLSLMKHQNFQQKLLHNWIILCLIYFHGLPSTIASKYSKEKVSVVDNGLNIQCGEFEYWIPSNSNQQTKDVRSQEHLEK